MAKTYQVIGACVTNIPVSTSQGTQLSTFYTGQILPADVPEARIQHLLSVGLIKEHESTEAAEAAAAPSGGETEPAVTARSSKPDLVAYGVARGEDRAELEKLTRDQLIAKYVRQPDKQ
ncbi:hypothetical protein [Nonomuraea angiospora]|uniref:hypothetical protein n=1 Tax=Nonomuraea angiospora TaxID=46172 RepID=UPI0029BBBC36|nr:hypothetical protein [Nonomuraea angiospora]MDX3100450.1 hypothetical protein [Nonomuraea angiospora]